MYYLFFPLMLLGLPIAILASLLGMKFGDGTGNESGMAEFFVFSFHAGIGVIVAVIVIGLTIYAVMK